MPPEYWTIGKKQHFICSNLTSFIVPFFLFLCFPLFFSFFLFFLFFFLFFFFSFSLGGDGLPAPLNDASVSRGSHSNLTLTMLLAVVLKHSTPFEFWNLLGCVVMLCECGKRCFDQPHRVCLSCVVGVHWCVWWSAYAIIINEALKQGFVSPPQASLTNLCQQADESLFSSSPGNRNHVLHCLLPPVEQSGYKLRPVLMTAVTAPGFLAMIASNRGFEAIFLTTRRLYSERYIGVFHQKQADFFRSFFVRTVACRTRNTTTYMFWKVFTSFHWKSSGITWIERPCRISGLRGYLSTSNYVAPGTLGIYFSNTV